MDVTKDSEKVFKYIYKMYLERRKNGKPKSESCQFDKDFYKSDRELSEWQFNDISFCLLELAQHGYIKTYLGCSFELLDSGIVYMENRVKNLLKEAGGALGNLAGIVSDIIPKA